MTELTSLSACDGEQTARPKARRFWQLRYHQRTRLWGFAFVLPTLIFFAVFKYGPMLWAIELSFHSYDMVSAPQFVGLDGSNDPVKAGFTGL